jgi:hypothetical protein
MLGHGGQKAFLIDGRLLQMPMDKEEIMAYVNVLEGDVADGEIAPPFAERHSVAPYAPPGLGVSLSRLQEQTTCHRGTAIHDVPVRGHQRVHR